MKNKILAVLIVAMIFVVPQAWANSNFNQNVKDASDMAIILGAVIAVPVAITGAVVLLPVTLLATLSGGMDH